MYSVEEVATHNKEDDGWLVIDGLVHNVTPFMNDHPGGKEIMMGHLGKDASAIFVDEREHSHSEAAFTMLEKYRIGFLDSYDPKKLESERTKDPLSGIIDVTAPIVPQLPKLGAKYQPWIHAQLGSGLKEIIIFDNFLENFTRWPWWYIFILWTPQIIYYIYMSLVNTQSVVKTFVYFASGMLSWSIVEYIFHRFIFHMHTETTGWNIFHFFAHGIHHLTPNDPSRLTFPPTFSGVISLLVYQLLKVAPIHGWFAGLGLGFVLYDALHYYFHHGDVPWLPSALRKLKSSHLAHHYKGEHNRFGVTSPLFDHVFGTVG